MRELTTRRRIEFSDTDLGGVVHFSRFFVFMETAEDELLRALGTSYTDAYDGRPGGWPKVAAACEYLSPAHYGDELEIHLRVEAITRSTVTYSFAFLRAGREIARGRTTSVCCAAGPGGAFESVPIPEALAGRLRAEPQAK